MKCPSCSHLEDKVVDSRGSSGGAAVRRRRECLSCKKRFTTYEQVESVMPLVIKRDGRREPFDRGKVLAGLRKACEKRPVSAEQLERVADDIESHVQSTHEKEVSSRRVGEAVVNALRDVDEVAYVRFASVYHQFKDVAEFQHEVDRLKRAQRARAIRIQHAEPVRKRMAGGSRGRLAGGLAALLLSGWAQAAIPQAAGGAPPKVVVVEYKGRIDAAASRYVERGLRLASERAAACVVLQLNTPGGFDPAMREIVENIYASRVPVVCFVAPKGARAASAGVFIALACSVVSMAPGTNIGAAHPVDMSGKPLSDKITNDAAAYLRSIAQRAGKDVQWAEDAVRTSVSISDQEAVVKRIADLSSPDLPELLRQLDGRTVKVGENTATLRTADAEVERVALTFWERLLSMLAEPNLAYVLFLLGLYGMIYELANPGAVVPGVIGSICLILGLVAFDALPVNVAGIALLILSVVMFVLDVKAPTHGALTIGGIAALFFGSVLLYSPSPYYRVARSVLATMMVVSVGFAVVLVWTTVRAMRRRPVFGMEAVVGLEGVAQTAVGAEGLVRAGGETWSAFAEGETIPAGAPVRVVETRGVRVKVEKQ